MGGEGEVPFRVEASDEGDGSWLVLLAGDVDLAVEAQARAVVDGCLEAGAVRLLFDMLAVTFCDSSCAKLLLRACRSGVPVTVRPSPRTRRTLEILGLRRVDGLVVEG